MSTTALERVQTTYRQEFEDGIQGATPGTTIRLANELRASGQTDAADALVREINQAESGGNTFECD